MAYVINEHCTACGNCVSVCPNHAIAAATFRYVISWHLCVECVGYADAPECAEHCPAGAVVPAEEQILSARQPYGNAFLLLNSRLKNGQMKRA